MTEFRSSSLEFGRAIRAAEKERSRSLDPVLEAYDAAVTEDERFAAAAELCLSVNAADLVYRSQVTAAGIRMRARDAAGGA